MAECVGHEERRAERSNFLARRFGIRRAIESIARGFASLYLLRHVESLRPAPAAQADTAAANSRVTALRCAMVGYISSDPIVARSFVWILR